MKRTKWNTAEIRKALKFIQKCKAIKAAEREQQAAGEHRTPPMRLPAGADV